MGKGGEKSSSSAWGVRRLFMHAEGGDYWLMALGLIGAAGDGISTPIMFILMKQIVNVFGGGPNSPDFVHGIHQSCLHFVYLAAGTFVMSFLEGYCWTRTGERQATRMRRRFLKAVLRQDVRYFDLKVGSTAEVIECISTDCLVFQDVLSEKVPNFLMHTCTFIGSYIIAFCLYWRLALVSCPTAILLIIPGLIYGRVMLSLTREIQIHYNKAGHVAEQAISSIRTVYSSVAETATITAYSSALNSSVRLGIRQGLAKGLAFGSNGVTFAIWAFMAWYSIRLVINEHVKGGTIFAVGSAVVTGGLSLGMTLSNVKSFGECIAGVQRISEVIYRNPAIDSESEEGEQVEEVRGQVEFKDVRFAYPARPEMEVFKGFSLKVEAGKTVALVGGSGSGKSTALVLLQRFYDPAGGGIEVDGVEIRRLKLKWLRGIMGLVSQEPLLFDMSIKENVLFGKEDGSMEEVVEAAKKANAHGFISQLPMGYDTEVGERGVQLSGGQKQRIAIARALIRNPKILLLDEATSALDSESERVVQEALDAAVVGRTTIVIAHRLSTIRNSDSIAFVNSGQVVEVGSHDQLIADSNTHYSTLVRAQQSQPPEDHEPMGSSRSMSRRFSVSSSIKSAGELDEWNQEMVEAEPYQSRKAPSFRRLLMMNKPEWRQAFLGCTAAVLFGTIQPAYAYAMSAMVMVYFIEDHEEMKDKVRNYTLLFTGLAIFSFIVNVVQHYNFGVMGECLTRRVRERMLSKILTFEVGWFDQDDNSTGAICSRLAKDASLVRSLVGDRTSLIIQALSSVTVAFTLGLIIGWRLALVTIATQPITIACFYARKVLLRNISVKSMKSQLYSSKLAAEAVSNLRTITSFSSQNRILHLFNLAQSIPRRESRHQSYVAGFGLAFSQSLTFCAWSVQFFYGGVLVHKGIISSKVFLQTFVIMVSTARVLSEAGSTTSDLAKGAHSVASVFSILDRFSSIEPDDPEAHQTKSLTGSIDFRAVEFAYPARPDVPILQDFSLSIQQGKSTALVGSSGSGKSTIISLIERFYDPTAGLIRIDGKDIRTYNLRSLRRQIGLVGQEPALFAGTIRENIMYGLDEPAVTEAEAEAAARVANAHDFISGLKDGYETWCGERGVQLSGGQKQRIAIARAVLRNPKILLLDEATSALDGQSEKVVQEALERVMVGRTSVVVAHRLSTIRNCDLIAVMDKGKLVEKGSHAVLMSKGATGMYCRLVSLQQGRNNGTP